MTAGAGVPPGAFARVASQDPALPPAGWGDGDSDDALSSRGSFGSLDEEYVRDSLAALGTPLPPAGGLGLGLGLGSSDLGSSGAGSRGAGGGGGGDDEARGGAPKGPAGEPAPPWFEEWSAGLEAQLRGAPCPPSDGHAVRPAPFPTSQMFCFPLRQLCLLHEESGTVQI